MSSPDQTAAPVSLGSTLLSFLASHLVILTLCLFLVIGLRLVGPWGGEPEPLESLSSEAGDGAAGPAMAGEQAASADVGESDAVLSPKAAVSGEVSGAEVMAPQPGAGDRPQPRMIGGSLPIYGLEDKPQGSGSESFSAPADGFRPEGDLSQTPPEPSLERSRDDLIQDARRAFWNGDFEGAEVAYVTILTRYPGDADTFGELGNLYQSMGRPEQAIDAYYEAAIRLKAQGNATKLETIIGLLEESGDPRAASLRP